MPVLAKQNKKKYTYRDYLGFNDNIRREIINGEIRIMSPAPLTIHQRIALKLSAIFYNYLKDKDCEVFIAPFDVRLSIYNERDMDEFNVAQPDISIICEKIKLMKEAAKARRI
jgi:Uma2 family endonuclease